MGLTFTKWDTYRNRAVTNTKIEVRRGPTSIYGYTINNFNASTVFLQMYDAAAQDSIVVGTTVADEAIQLPISGAVVEPPLDSPILHFANGLVIVATTGETNGDAPTTPISVAIRYK